MSASAHEAEASRHQAEAQGHGSQFDPSASAQVSRCRGLGKPNLAEPCWSETTNPTSGHAEEAERHRKMAADHRAGSKALRDAEESACVGLNANDRDASPFAHRDDVAAVEPLIAKAASPKAAPAQRTVGASVTLRAVPGLTKEYLERLVACHIARNGSMGHLMPEMAYCPLAVKGASASVEGVSGGFRVDVRSDDPAAAEEIQKRAKALTATR